MQKRSGMIFRAVVLAFLTPLWARGLAPDQIALVVNRNLPISGALASYYARARGIPDGRIIELPLPISEEMPFEMYERAVVPPIREFLRRGGLEEKVTCLVTFHGVPFRIGPHLNTPREVAESAGIRDDRDKAQRMLESSVAELEKYVVSLHPDFEPPAAGNDPLSLAGRADAAFRFAQQRHETLDPASRSRSSARLIAHMEQLTGAGSIIEQLSLTSQPIGGAAEAHTPPTNQEPRDVTQLRAMKDRFEKARLQATKLYDRRYDPQSRADLRKLTREHLGLFGYARLLDLQIQYFDSDYTVAALDNELSLLWWDYYSRKHWVPNPLHYAAAPQSLPPVMMVMRLDGPQAGTARKIIDSSIRAEKDGLHGRVALDSRGIPPANEHGKPDAYGAYDQTIRNLGQLLRTRTKLPLTIDDNPGVLPPRAVRDVSLYCGWYSLRNYIPGCTFAPGAVGYHIASLEMVSLRGAQENGWVKGLLNDGIAGTMGAVAEPYLHSFPRADEFFPLLLSGKLTLAEVYWKTTPLASWMLCMIGDPLYTPYQRNPALKIDDLPQDLRAAFAVPAAASSRPATAPTQAPPANGR